MTSEQLSNLAAEIAVESICIDAGEQMIESDDMRERILWWRKEGDQRWLMAHRQATNALIALKKLGYSVSNR